MTHTPGPWQTVNADDGDILIENGDPYGNGIVAAIITSESYFTDDQCEANARLIAEAPAMLEALRAIVLESDSGADTLVLNVANIRAIINRIEGGQD
jgi:hypothetical protein